jgi:hyaluronoglucosaminidase
MTGSTSPFAIRGVIEGFYGNPWTHEQRLDMIRFIGSRGMNTYVYGPKDDPLVRRRWRDRYDGAALARLAEVVAAGKAAGVDIVYAISPGLSIRYSSVGDLGELVAKLEQVAVLGIRTFALLLDDLPVELIHDEDRATFVDLAHAHATLASQVAEDLGPARSLMVCPLVYHGTADDPYLDQLGAALDPRVDVMWTGREICSHVLATDDARRFEAVTGRPPLYWDNYPVNDVAMGFELHIGPYVGRDPDLHTASRGILANPMELPEASKIPLGTIADYLADPEGYDPEASIARAIRDVAGDGSADGGRDAEAFALFAENVRSSCLSDADSPTVTAALSAFDIAADEAAQTGDRTRLASAAADLRRLAERQLAAADHLLRGTPANAALIEECEPWIEAFEVGARAMCRAAELAAEGVLPGDLEAVRAALLPSLADLRHRRVRVFGDALDMFLADTTVTHTRPGRLLPTPGGGIQ